jgi:hypothetical protein
MRGRHIYFKSSLNKARNYSFGELKSEKVYVVLPPSLHPAGCEYEWLIPMNGQLPEYNPSSWIDGYAGKTDRTGRVSRT